MKKNLKIPLPLFLRVPLQDVTQSRNLKKFELDKFKNQLDDITPPDFYLFEKKFLKRIAKKSNQIKCDEFPYLNCYYTEKYCEEEGVFWGNLYFCHKDSMKILTGKVPSKSRKKDNE